MKKILLILAAVIGFVAVVAISAAGYFAAHGVPTYDPPKTPDLKVEITPQRIIRGEKIAHLLCIECHRNPQTNRLSGRVQDDTPEELGTGIHSYNITQDQAHGIGSWTDGELLYFLRTGVRRNGSYAPPFMPKFALMADEDIQSVIAWLRSPDNEMAHADPTPSQKNEYNFLVKALCNTVIKPLPYPTQAIRIPDSTDKVAFGRYVANGLSGCFACHSHDFKKLNDLEPEKSEGYYGGGNPLIGKNHQTVYSANITMDEETGIGNKYTEDSFVKAVRFGQGANGPLRYPMFPHSSLSDYEVRAIWAFLQTVPKIKNKVGTETAG